MESFTNISNNKMDLIRNYDPSSYSSDLIEELWESVLRSECPADHANRLIKLKKSYKPIYLERIIKHEFSHFTLFTKIILINKEKIIKNAYKGEWVNQRTINKLPISNLTKKVINYSLDEISSLIKFL